MRKREELYPDYGAEAAKIKQDGISEELLNSMIDKHKHCRNCMKKLYERYEVLQEAVPIFQRKPRFEEDTINNRVNNDFFGEICDFKIGYFAGKPISYSYNRSEDSKADTGGEEAVGRANKVLADFVYLNSFPDVDMEVTKFATVCGYSGRLLYHDPEGRERAMPTPPWETILLSEMGDITEPDFAVRYCQHKDLDNVEYWTAEFYDGETIRFYRGDYGALKDTGETKENLYELCPLQGVPNNLEMLGDAEKVLGEIDDYDRVFSDESNEIESFANAYMEYKNVQMEDGDIDKAQSSGSIQYSTDPGVDGHVGFITKDTSGTQTQQHLDRLEDNIYRFSKTPNLNDESFGTASGVALKFRLTGLESKCGMFQSKMQKAGIYLFRALAKAWGKKGIRFDPLEVDMKFSRNFSLDLVSEAQAAQTMIAAGLPKRVVYGLAFSGIDDVDEVLQEIENEKEDIPPLEEGQVTVNAGTSKAADTGQADQ